MQDRALSKRKKVALARVHLVVEAMLSMHYNITIDEANSMIVSNKFLYDYIIICINCECLAKDWGVDGIKAYVESNVMGGKNE